ncbi:MAG: hypothetical protein JXB10_16435 [Pirellulales bacterium]|nr:hypothetical protein [Pirellulales bacterium]
MTPSHQESWFHPYTKKTLLLVRCVFAVGGGALAVGVFWHPALVVGLLFLFLVWITYETTFRSQRRRREEILRDGWKTTAKVVDKTHDLRRRLCFFLVQYEDQGQILQITACVPDALFYQCEIDDPVEIIVHPTRPKLCIVLGK